VSQDFLLLVFFHESVSPQPQNIPLGLFQIFRKFAEIFTSQGAPPVSTTLMANFSTSFSSVVETGVNKSGGKFATGVNNPGGKLPSVTKTPVANNGNNYQTAGNLK
jgi:hypothetical protein